jgi:hypothetical protein
MWDVNLSTPPTLLPPTLPLIRVRDHLNAVALAPKLDYLPSHWYNSRSFPCTMPLIQTCPWCDKTPKRLHAYLPILLKPPTADAYQAILELPATAATAAYNDHQEPILYHYCTITRRHKKATPQITFGDQIKTTLMPPMVQPLQTLRTLCKIYALPDPLNYSSHAEWSLAVKLRISQPTYSPSRSQPPTC